MMQLLARWRNYKDLLSSEVDGTDVGNQCSACTCTQRTTVASPALQVIDNTDQRAAKTSLLPPPADGSLRHARNHLPVLPPRPAKAGANTVVMRVSSFLALTLSVVLWLYASCDRGDCSAWWKGLNPALVDVRRCLVVLAPTAATAAAATATATATTTAGAPAATAER